MSRFFLVSCFAYLFLFGNTGQLCSQNKSENTYKRLAQAQKLFNRGIPYLNAAQYDSASYCFIGSLQLYHKAKNRKGVLSSGIYLAISLKNEGKFPDFLAYEDEVESYLNESDSLFTQIKLSLGAAHFAKGNYLPALRYLKRSQNSFEDQKSSNFALLLHIYRNQAQVYRKLGCPGPELSIYQKILNLEKEKEILLNSEDKLKLLIHTSKAFAKTDQAEEAQKNLGQAIRLLKELQPDLEKEPLGGIYSEIGSVYESLGEYAHASAFFTKKILPLTHTDSTYAPVLFRLAKLAFLSKRYPNALDSLKIVEKLLEAGNPGDTDLLAETYFLIGETYRIPNENPDNSQRSPSGFDPNLTALENYQKVLALWVEGYEGNSVNKIPELNKIPQTKMAHDLLWAYAQALKNQLPFFDRDAVFQIKRCLATYQKAINLGDLIRKNIRIEEIELTPLDSLASRYEEAIQVATSLFSHEQDDRYLGIAFQFQQRKKSTENRELFWNYFRNNGFPWSLEEQIERRDFIVRIEENEERLSHMKNEEERQLIRGIKGSLTDEYESFISSLSYSHKAYFSLKNKRDYTDIAELREYLQQGEILISFFQGNKYLHIYSLDKGHLEVQKVERVNMQFDVLSFLELLNSPKSTPANYAHKAIDLYRNLLAPSLPDTLNSLIIVPDGILHYLPIEALLSSDTIPEEFSKLNYLIKKYPIRYLQHSSDLLPRKNQNRSHDSNDSENRYAAFFPTYANEAFEWLDSLQLSSEEQVQASTPFIPSLKNQENELQRRVDLMKGDAFMSKKTTKRNFGRYGPRYNSIDIAGYALSTDYQPLYSGLAFANQREREANFLHAHEIAQKIYPNDLITLPNHTGLGEKTNGRGIKALLSSFQLAQCQNVSLSLWQVEGSSNQELLSHFYRNLYTGLGKAQSLQEAKLNFLSETDVHQHPYYWASMVLYGDNIELKGAERPWWSYGALFFALFMILLILFGFRRKRKRRL